MTLMICFDDGVTNTKDLEHAQTATIPGTLGQCDTKGRCWVSQTHAVGRSRERDGGNRWQSEGVIYVTKCKEKWTDGGERKKDGEEKGMAGNEEGEKRKRADKQNRWRNKSENRKKGRIKTLYKYPICWLLRFTLLRDTEMLSSVSNILIVLRLVTLSGGDLTCLWSSFQTASAYPRRLCCF